MTSSSTLDPDSTPGGAARRPKGHDIRSLGPSDSSDTGSDSVGETGLDPVILAEDGDATGTGVDPSPVDARSDDTDADIGFDRVVGAAEAGLGGGLDQAEEARYGVTDERLDPVDEAGAPLDPVSRRHDGGDGLERASDLDGGDPDTPERGDDPGTLMDHLAEDASDADPAADPDGSGERHEATREASIEGVHSTIDRGPGIR